MRTVYLWGSSFNFSVYISVMLGMRVVLIVFESFESRVNGNIGVFCVSKRWKTILSEQLMYFNKNFWICWECARKFGKLIVFWWNLLGTNGFEKFNSLQIVLLIYNLLVVNMYWKKVKITYVHLFVIKRSS